MRRTASLASVAKVRGRQAVQPKFLELLAARTAGHTRYNLAVANGGAPQEMEALAKKMKAAFSELRAFLNAEIDANAVELYWRRRAGAQAFSFWIEPAFRHTRCPENKHEKAPALPGRGFSVRRSLRQHGEPPGIRTPDPLLKRQLLCPTELAAHMHLTA